MRTALRVDPPPPRQGFMLAGLVGATINYPFDLVKGRMMAEAHFATTGQISARSTPAVFAQIVREGGVAGLFRGLPTRSALHAVVWCVVGIGREACVGNTLGGRSGPCLVWASDFKMAEHQNYRRHARKRTDLAWATNFAKNMSQVRTCVGIRQSCGTDRLCASMLRECCRNPPKPVGHIWPMSCAHWTEIGQHWRKIGKVWPTLALRPPTIARDQPTLARFRPKLSRLKRRNDDDLETVVERRGVWSGGAPALISFGSSLGPRWQIFVCASRRSAGRAHQRQPQES